MSTITRPNMTTAPSAHHRRAWQTPAIVPPSAAAACAEAEERQKEARALTSEHRAAESAVMDAERSHAAAVKAAVAAGKPSPARDASLVDRVADLAERLTATIDLKAEAAKRAHRALIDAAPDMVATLPERISAVLDDIDAKGLTEARAIEVEHLLSAVGFYRNLDRSPGSLTWRPVTVEMSACRGSDAVGIHRAATQAALARVLGRPVA